MAGTFTPLFWNAEFGGGKKRVSGSSGRSIVSFLP